jgi:phosphoribosyl 1,2-cyclic phosphate phosphodiesterase
MPLSITFLGTGTSQGVPIIACECDVCTSDDPFDKRLRTSAMIESEGTVVVIDAGPDFRQQMLREKVKKIDAVLLTHEHKDHLAGLDDVRAFNYRWNEPVNVYGTVRVLHAVKREFAYAFEDNPYPGVPKIALHEINENPFFINQLEITPIEVLHHQMPVNGFRFHDFTYITDAKTISAQELNKIKGSRVLVLNALRRESHISHLTLQEAIDLAALIEPEACFLTHMSHQIGKHKEISKLMPPKVYFAHDGLKIRMSDFE